MARCNSVVTTTFPSNKTVVIAGSSNGAGVGASTYVGEPSQANGWYSPATSWAGLLTSYLVPKGYKVFNRSMSGTTYANLVSRFWTDIAVHNPSHVILCVASANGGYDMYNDYQRLKTLVGYCNQIGAIPIIRSAYPHNAMNATQYQQCQWYNQAIQRLGVWTIDHMSGMDDGTGKFLNVTPSLHSGDGQHPSDRGYSDMYYAIDRTMFDSNIQQGDVDITDKVAVTPSSGITTSSGMIISPTSGLPSDGLTSFTMSCRVKGTSTSPGARAFMSCNLPGPLRVRNANSVYDLAGATPDVASTINAVADTIHTLDMVVHYQLGLVYLYIDGVLIGSGGYTPALCTQFCWIGRPDTTGAFPYTYSFSNVSLWCVPLSAKEIKKKYITGVAQTSSLIYKMNCNDYMCYDNINGTFLTNIIRNNITAIAPSTLNLDQVSYT